MIDAKLLDELSAAKAAHEVAVQASRALADEVKRVHREERETYDRYQKALNDVRDAA